MPAQAGWPPGLITVGKPNQTQATHHHQYGRKALRPTGAHTTMTTEVTTANKGTVVGMRGALLLRDRNAKRSEGRKMVEVTKKVGRDHGTGGRHKSMKLQVRSPYGGMFALPIEIEPDVPGAELLEAAEAETILAI